MKQRRQGYRIGGRKSGSDCLLIIDGPSATDGMTSVKCSTWTQLKKTLDTLDEVQQVLIAHSSAQSDSLSHTGESQGEVEASILWCD